MEYYQSSNSSIFFYISLFPIYLLSPFTGQTYFQFEKNIVFLCV